MKLEKLKVMFLLYSVAEPSFFGGIYIFKSPFIFFCHLYVIPFFKKKTLPIFFSSTAQYKRETCHPSCKTCLGGGKENCTTCPPGKQAVCCVSLPVKLENTLAWFLSEPMLYHQQVINQPWCFSYILWNNIKYSKCRKMLITDNII